MLIHQSRRNSNIKIYRPVQRTGSNNACYPTFDKYSTAASSYCNSRKSHYRKTLSIILPTSPLWLSRSLCKHHEPILSTRRQYKKRSFFLPTSPRSNIVLTPTRLGATGFIGGDLLASLQEQHPEYEITCLVRTLDKADNIRAVYPDVKVVLGDNESAEIVERETMNADIVFRECRFEINFNVPSSLIGSAFCFSIFGELQTLLRRQTMSLGQPRSAELPPKKKIQADLPITSTYPVPVSSLTKPTKVNRGMVKFTTTGKVCRTSSTFQRRLRIGTSTRSSWRPPRQTQQR